MKYPDKKPLTLAQTGCGKESSGSRHESHMIVGYCEDLRRRTGRSGIARCSDQEISHLYPERYQCPHRQNTLTPTPKA